MIKKLREWLKRVIINENYDNVEISKEVSPKEAAVKSK